MLFGLNQKTIDQLNSVFQKYSQIKQVKIYGSRVREDYRKGSDIDFVFFTDESKEDLSPRLSWELDELSTPYLFDVVNYTLLNASLKKEIDQYGKVFYTKAQEK